MSWFGKILDSLRDYIAGTLRKFVTFSVLMFFLGSFYGVYVTNKVVQLGVSDPFLLLLIPLGVAILTYISTEFAAFIFLLMLGLFLIVFV
ncbi:hypothetical protein HUU53_02675 [Candidatus Micrarchaeota archaeon]|nr:hypothetical protein [Candidatus Micrarchaeota archaeon]